MKFAIIANIHANLEAFQAVLEHANRQSCTHYYVTYDLREALVELHRVRYDIATTQWKIKEAGLPDW